jgi:micrococcal nuclease
MQKIDIFFKKNTLINFFLVILFVFFIFLLFLNVKQQLIKKGFFNKNESVVKYFKVKEIIDGDTIVLENGDTVRYLGIDTPETHHPKIGVECGGREAEEENKKLLKNKKVRLIKDETEKDRYGRLLRYVFTEDGVFVNYELVRNGFAQTLEIPPDHLFRKTLLDAQNIAVKEKLGIWSKCFNRKEVNNK